MKTPELWKPIQELDENYHISNRGEVKSFMQDKVNGRLLTPQKMSNGYIMYLIHYKNEWLSFYAHRLCAQYFLPNPENLPEVHHLNKQKDYNDIQNLKWITHIDNVRLDQSKNIICKHPDGRQYLAQGTRHAEQLTGVPRRTVMKALASSGKTTSNWIFKYNK
jgi:hypothetical protein